MTRTRRIQLTLQTAFATARATARTAAFALAAAVAIFPASGATQVLDERARVEAVVRATFSASEAGDLRALDTLYRADATIVEGAGLDRGWANYRDHHLAPELKEFRDFRYRPSEIEVTVDGATAWVTFRYTIGATMATRTIDAVGRGTMILRRVDGRWFVQHSHTSSRARRPTDAP